MIASTAEAGKNSIGNQFAGNMANGLLAGGTAALSGLADGDIAGALTDDSTGLRLSGGRQGKMRLRITYWVEMKKPRPGSCRSMAKISHPVVPNQA